MQNSFGFQFTNNNHLELTINPRLERKKHISKGTGNVKDPNKKKSLIIIIREKCGIHI